MSFYRPSSGQSGQFTSSPNPPNSSAHSKIDSSLQRRVDRYHSNPGSDFTFPKPDRLASGLYRPDYGVTLNDQIGLRPYKHKRDEESNDSGDGEPSGYSKIAANFADKTSIQGILYIKESGNWMSRSMWIFLFLCGTAAVMWQLTEIVKKYMQHPVGTTINIGYSTLEFPTVTICNMNPIRNSMLSEDEKLDKYIKTLSASWQNSDFAGKPAPTRPPPLEQEWNK